MTVAIHPATLFRCRFFPEKKRQRKNATEKG